MVNVRFGSYEDFLKYFEKAPRYIQNILYKAYPDYAKKMTNDYLNSIKKIGTKAKETVTNPTKAIGTIKSQTKTKAKSLYDTFQGALGKVNKATENIKGTGAKTESKANGFKPTKLGTAGAIWGILDPKTSWNQKVLSGGLAFPATAPYAAAGLITTAVAPAGIDAYYDKKFEKDTRYNLPEGHMPNEWNLAPELKELTPAERDKYSQYYFGEMHNMIDKGSNMLQEEIDKWDNLIDRTSAVENLANNALIEGIEAPTFPSQYNINPKTYNQSIISRPPVNNTQNVQNALQPRANINQDTNIVPNYQQALTANVAPVNYQFDIPDYKTLNLAIQDDISKLQDMVNITNGTYIPNRNNTLSLQDFKNNINPADYTTKLTPDEQKQFNIWSNDMKAKGLINPNDNFQDYDMQGYWKNEVLNNTNLANGNAQAHFTDKYKMPNHPTFSNDSIYAVGDNAKYAGYWNGDKYIPPTITNKENTPMNNQGNIAAGSEALANYLAMVEGNQAALQKQQQQQASEILKNYQQAMKADRLQNIANAFANMNNYTTERAPFEQVLPNGQVITMRFDKQVPGRQLPTNTTSNVDNYTQMVKNQLALQPKAVDNTALTEKALTAQAMANKYGVDPLIFLNDDLALEYMKGQNTIANTQTTGTERRKDIPLNVQGDVIRENAKGMNDLMVDAFNNQYSMALEQLKQRGMNDRQAQELAYRTTIAQFSKDYDAYLKYQEFLYDMKKARLNANTQLGVANIYSQRPTNTADPLQDMYKKSQIFSTGMAIQNPMQQQQYWEYVTGNTPGAVTPTQFGTTIDQEQILRNSRRRR